MLLTGSGFILQLSDIRLVPVTSSFSLSESLADLLTPLNMTFPTITFPTITIPKLPVLNMDLVAVSRAAGVKQGWRGVRPRQFTIVAHPNKRLHAYRI